jgi:integrase/recombinase XerC
MLAHERHLSARTLAMYALALEELLQALQPLALEQLNPGHIRRGVAHLQRKQQSPRSIAIALAAWRGYYRWLARQGKVQTNPVQGLRAPRAAKLLPKALAPDASAQLLEFTAHTPADKRDRAMFELLYSSGLRLNELVYLDWRPGSQALGWLSDDLREAVVTGKGQKRRMVPVGTQASQALQSWLEVRSELAKADEPALFVGARGQRISAGVVQRLLKQRALQQGLPTSVHPHMLRHSFASHVLQSSGDLRAVQEMLGHASIATTQVYTKLDFQHLAKVYDAAHPRARKK